MTNINISTPWFLPAYKAGGPLQSLAGLVQHMEGDQFSFQIFTSNKDLDGTVLDVPVDTWVDYNAATKVWYSSDNKILPLLKKEIERDKPACLYIIGIYDWHYNIKPLLFVKGVKKIVSVRGMLHPGALSQKAFKKKAFLFLLKLWGWQRKVVFHVTDENEKLYVEREIGNRQLAIGNKQGAKGNRQLAKGNKESADENYGKFSGQKVEEKNKLDIRVAGNFSNLFERLEMPEKEAGRLKLVSVGLVSPMKNYLLVLQAMGNGHRAMGNQYIEYNIYGPIKDAVYWEECKAVIKTLPDNIVVHYHGAIEPSAVKGALAASHVFILPSKSENFGHAIVEALSAGRPVITSNGTPWNGLRGVKAGVNVEIEVIGQRSLVIDRSEEDKVIGQKSLVIDRSGDGKDNSHLSLVIDRSEEDKDIGQKSLVIDRSGDGKGSGDPGGQELDVVAIGNKQLAISNGLSDAIIFFVNMGQQELQEWSEGARTYVNKAISVEEIKEAYLRLFG